MIFQTIYGYSISMVKRKIEYYTILEIFNYLLITMGFETYNREYLIGFRI